MLDLFHAEEGPNFHKFFEFKALVEKELGRNIKALRSENGGEYVSQEFKDFGAAEGIE